MALDGADAQALEHALTITERERDNAVTLLRNLLAVIRGDDGTHTEEVGLAASCADALVALRVRCADKGDE
jgi:hypothetical protein